MSSQWLNANGIKTKKFITADTGFFGNRTSGVSNSF